MKIEKIVNDGDSLSDKQLSDIYGGSDMMANTNDAIYCCPIKVEMGILRGLFR